MKKNLQKKSLINFSSCIFAICQIVCCMKQITHLWYNSTIVILLFPNKRIHETNKTSTTINQYVTHGMWLILKEFLRLKLYNLLIK